MSPFSTFFVKITKELQKRHFCPFNPHITPSGDDFWKIIFSDCIHRTRNLHSQCYLSSFSSLGSMLMYQSVSRLSPFIQGAPKISRTFSMLCRTTNWSLFKKEPLSGIARFGCCRVSKFENKQVAQFVPIHFSVLLQQVCKSLVICGIRYKCAE